MTTTTTKRTPTGDAPDDVPHGVDPTVGYMMRALERQHLSASTERQAQTEQFTGALDKLGGRFEAKMDTNTNAMVKAANLAAGIVVITLVILGSIAGAVTYFKGGGAEFSTNHGVTSSATP